MEEKRGCKFDSLLEENKLVYGNSKEAIGRTIFYFIAGDDGKIQISELESLLVSWGVPDHKSSAGELFLNADLNNDNALDYDEFKGKLGFMIDNVYHKGDFDRGIPGYTWTLSPRLSQGTTTRTPTLISKLPTLLPQCKLMCS